MRRFWEDDPPERDWGCPVSDNRVLNRYLKLANFRIADER
jgi:hypothetical protein